MADGGPEDVAGGVEAGVKETFGGIEGLCYGGARDEEGGGMRKAAEVEDAAVVNGVHTGGGDGEVRTFGGLGTAGGFAACRG